jgi:prepilin-type N-terminal cleavage/methylation domain-containing protein
MKRGDVRMARGFTVLELLLTLTVGALVTVAGEFCATRSQWRR